MRFGPSSLFAAAALFAGMSSAAHAGCVCIADGARYTEGQTACLKLPSGTRLARCEKVLNNSSWKILQDGCNEISALSAARQIAALGDETTVQTVIPARLCAAAGSQRSFD